MTGPIPLDVPISAGPKDPGPYQTLRDPWSQPFNQFGGQQQYPQHACGHLLQDQQPVGQHRYQQSQYGQQAQQTQMFRPPQPSWQQQVPDTEAPDAYYHSLNHPWNIVPNIISSQKDDYLKHISNGRLVTFDGKRACYTSWRDKFIQFIHMKRTSPAAKALALQASLDTKCAELKALAECITYSEQGYKDAIEDLEGIEIDE